MHIPPCEIEEEKRIAALEVGISYFKPTVSLNQRGCIMCSWQVTFKKNNSVYALNANMIAQDYKSDAQRNG